MLAFAWLQLAVGLAIAIVVLIGCVTFNAAIRDGSRSAAAVVTSVAEAMEAASKAIEARRVLIANALAALEVATGVIDQAEGLGREQAMAAPQYALGLRAAAELSSKVADMALSTATSMNIEILTGVTREGLKPLWTTSKPFETTSKKLSETAVQVKIVSSTLSTIATSVDSGAKSLNVLVVRSSHEAKDRLDELRKSLAQASSKEIPEALANLKKTSDNLRVLSTTIAAVEDHGSRLLVGGFLISAWLLLNGLTTVGLVSTVRHSAALRGISA